MPTDKPRKPTKKSSSSKIKEKATKAPTRGSSKERKRAEKLFSDIESLALQEPADTEDKPRKRSRKRVEKGIEAPSLVIPEELEIQHELETLRARVLELETQLERVNKSNPDLYEKEQVGYAFKENKLESLIITKWKEDIDAKNAIRAPLMATGQTIGDMVVEAAPEHHWEAEDEKLVNTVAQQASLQIQSLRLLAAAERARAESESATRRFMHEGWAWKYWR